MIRLVTLYPQHLNLNGDQGNLLVLAKRFEAAGLAFEQISFQVGDDVGLLDGANFILIGHGGVAAWCALEGELPRISNSLHAARSSGTFIFAVASGAEKLFAAPLNWFAEELDAKPRSSHFATAELAGFEVLGYENSASTLPVLEQRGSVVITALHGPVLAKNVNFANWVLDQVSKGAARGSTLAKADAYAAEVLKLERDLANQ